MWCSAERASSVGESCTVSPPAEWLCALRHPDPARIELRAIGFDRVTVVPADVRDQASAAAAIAGADAVVNTVSAYVKKSGVTFEAVHVQGADTAAREAVAARVARLVLVSGIANGLNSLLF